MLINFISIFSGLISIASAVGFFNPEVANIFSLTGLPLVVIFGISLLITLTSGSAVVYRNSRTSIKNQSQIGGKNNTQNMG